MISEPGWAIGVDVGGTKIAAGLVEVSRGTMSQRRTVATQAHRGGQHVLERTRAIICDLLSEANQAGVHVAGIGIGLAELVTTEGQVVSEHTIAWQGLAVSDALAARAPTTLDADVRAGARAEAMYGAGRNFRLFVYVSVGTGISCCLVHEGEPFKGAHGHALILASSPVATLCSHCGNMSQTSLEDTASGPALVTRYNAAASASLRRAEDVVQAAQVGDQQAQQVIQTAAQALGSAVAWLVNVLDPEAVVVGGGLGLAGGDYWDHFVLSLRQHIWADSNRQLPVLPAALGHDAPLIGAAALAYSST